MLDGLTLMASGFSSDVTTPITDGRVQISGSFTQAQANTLANQLSFGSLPLTFTVQSEQQISATLGIEQLRHGLIAGLVGFLLIIVYLAWQYRGLAVVAVTSLVAAAGVTYLAIALLSWAMSYRLSLAGVAGLIISIGITMDSFIIYFVTRSATDVPSWLPWMKDGPTPARRSSSPTPSTSWLRLCSTSLRWEASRASPSPWA